MRSTEKPLTNDSHPIAIDSTVVLPFGGCPSIAVLPLHALTPDSQSQIFGDAIAQEVIVELSRLRSLMVISRGSSFQFRGPAV